MKTKSEQRIEKMRSGEKVKCPRCADGYFSAVGDPDTTHVFRCSHCHIAIVETVPIQTQ